MQILTCDEQQVYNYTETKRSSVEWCAKDETISMKAKRSLSAGKVPITDFQDAKGDSCLLYTSRCV